MTRYVAQPGDAILKGVLSAVLLLGAELALASAPGDTVLQGNALPPATWKKQTIPICQPCRSAIWTEREL